MISINVGNVTSSPTRTYPVTFSVVVVVIVVVVILVVIVTL